MLELLSLRKGTTLTKEMFLNHLYGGMDEPELKIIDVFICKLRKETRRRDQWRQLHRDRLGPRLCAARSRRSAGSVRSSYSPIEMKRAPRGALFVRGRQGWVSPGNSNSNAFLSCDFFNAPNLFNPSAEAAAALASAACGSTLISCTMKWTRLLG